MLVADFEMSGKKDEDAGALLSDLVTVGLSKDYPVVDRKQLKRVLAEQKLSLTGLIDPEQGVKAGKLIGARLVVAGRVFRLKDDTVAVVRVVSVETSRFKGVTVQMPGEFALGKLAEKMAQELLKALPRLQAELTAAMKPGALKPIAPAAKVPFPLASVAVLNFANSGQGDPEWDWLGKGLADLTIGDLASQDFRVVSREQMQEIVQELSLKKKFQDPQSVAGVLKAIRCVHGSFRIAGGEAVLNASILDVTTGEPLHLASYFGPQADVLSLQKQLAAELADVLKGNRAGTLDAAKLPSWTENLKASQLLYQGVHLFDMGEYLSAWGLFRRALRQDENYADALYWSGRMMYFVQEYHQSRVDLERFAMKHPRHQRAGDAVQEIINAVQQSATSADEVLQILALAQRVAPKAEVHNQFGAGNSSTVGLYAAGLTEQILSPQGRYKEAFENYARHLDVVKVNHPLYWIAWHEMFSLKVKHLRTTGESLTMPERPRPEWLGEDLQRYQQRENSRHQLEFGVGTTIYGGMNSGIAVKADDATLQEFVRLSPENKTVELDFSKEPLVPRLRKNSPPADSYFWAQTYTHYFHADPQYYLTGLDIEVRYRHDPRKEFVVHLEGSSGVIAEFPLAPAGAWNHYLALTPGTRALGLSLKIPTTVTNAPNTDSTTAAITSWKVTAHLRRCDAPTGTLILRPSAGLKYQAKLNGAELPVSEARTVRNVPAGKHQLEIEPKIWGPNQKGRTTFTLEPGEVVEIELSAKIDPRRRDENKQAWQLRRINTAYEAFRTGPRLGDQTGRDEGDICFCRDRAGRWIVVWGMRRDFYLTTSSDEGRTWTPTVALPPPVNSAHNERFPVLTQDEEGRFLLLFSSDRNLSRSNAVYVCWSDDLVNFSNPVMVSAEPARAIRILRRADGMYLLYHFTPGAWKASTSQDLVHWTAPQGVGIPVGFPRALDVFEDGGRFIALHRNRSKPEMDMATSEDGIRFSPATPVAYPAFLGGDKSRLVAPTFIHAQRVGGKVLAIGHMGMGTAVVLRWQDDNTWKQIANPQAVKRAEVIFGEFAVSENAVSFFGLPFSSGFWGSLEEAAAVPGRPLFMYHAEYDWQPLLPDHPLALAAPTGVEARILKRYPGK